MTFIISILLGAAWRRWFGSARPEWAFVGYRAFQVGSGIGGADIRCHGWTDRRGRND